MRFKEVDNRMDLSYICAGCNRTIVSVPVNPRLSERFIRSKVWADLDGRSFKDYYCDECKTEKETS